MGQSWQDLADVGEACAWTGGAGRARRCFPCPLLLCCMKEVCETDRPSCLGALALAMPSAWTAVSSLPLLG